jgi:hypothetical protein
MDSYQFGVVETCTLAQVRRGDPMRQHQVQQALEAYAGASYADLDAAITALATSGTLDEDAFTVDFYAITRGGEDAPAFAMCVVFSDNGVVYPVGSSEPTAVHCAQSNFWSVDDDDADAVALAEALNEVVPF